MGLRPLAPSPKTRQVSRGQGFGHHSVGDQGVDADPALRPPGKAPGVGSFAPRAAVEGEQDLLSRVGAARQGPGIRHMDPDSAAVSKLHFGQEPLPSLQEAGGD
ncbi:MAG: hypothetical protein Q8M54_12295 [Desulfobaccales bacterium]|nr:hypothetical protein [Desulfobaccales bacterium]